MKQKSNIPVNNDTNITRLSPVRIHGGVYINYTRNGEL